MSVSVVAVAVGFVGGQKLGTVRLGRRQGSVGGALRQKRFFLRVRGVAVLAGREGTEREEEVCMSRPWRDRGGERGRGERVSMSTTRLFRYLLVAVPEPAQP